MAWLDMTAAVQVLGRRDMTPRMGLLRELLWDLYDYAVRAATQYTGAFSMVQVNRQDGLGVCVDIPVELQAAAIQEKPAFAVPEAPDAREVFHDFLIG
jgi:hypothetical protein